MSSDIEDSTADSSLNSFCSSVCFLIVLCCIFRAGSDEIDRQEAGENGYHARCPEAAHPAAGSAASCPRGSQDPSTSHTR